MLKDFAQKGTKTEFRPVLQNRNKIKHEKGSMVMKKSIAITIIAILAVTALAMGALYVTNNDNKTKEIVTKDAVIADKVGEIEQLNTMISAKEGEIEALNTDVENKAEQIEKLNTEVATKIGEIETLNADVGDKANQIEQLKAEISAKVGEIETLKVDVENKAGQIESLHADIIEKANKIDALNEDATIKAEQINLLTKDISEKDKHIDNLAAEAIEKDIIIDTQKNEINSLNKLLAYSEMDETEILSVADNVDSVLASFGYTVLRRNYNKEFNGISDVDKAFLNDLSSGLKDYYSFTIKDLSIMTSKQQLEYISDLIMCELNYTQKYKEKQFSDKHLEELAYKVISSMESSLDIFNKYLISDPATCQEKIQEQDDLHKQMVYLIMREYTLDLPENILQKFAQEGSLINQGKEYIKSLNQQLADLNIAQQAEWTATNVPLLIKNTSAFTVYSISIEIYLYDVNNVFLGSHNLLSAYGFLSGEERPIKAATIREKYDHAELRYEFSFSGSDNRKFSGIVKLDGTQIADSNIYPNVNTEKENCSDDAYRSTINDNGILFLDIPWGISIKDYYKQIADKGFVREKDYFGGNEKLLLYPEDSSVLEEFYNNTVSKQYVKSYGHGVTFDDYDPLARFSGIDCAAYRFGYYYGLNDDGTIDEDETHVYTVEIEFWENTDAKVLISTLTDKYGEPIIDDRDGWNMKANIWTDGDTKVVLFYINNWAVDIWYIDTELSDLVRERINNSTIDILDKT